MQQRRQWLLGLSIVLMLAGVWTDGRSFAAIRRDLGEDCVAFGEWQVRGGKGYFRSPEELAPGKKLAVKIWLEQPGETVTVKFFIEALDQSLLQFKKDYQDNSTGDVLPTPKVMVVELLEVPQTPVARYLVEVQDRSGDKPLVRSLEGTVESADFAGRVGKAIGDTAGTIWRLPAMISNQILGRERGVETTAPQPLRTLVIADPAGKIIKTSLPLPTGEIQTPLWLPDQRILFVEQQAQVSRLKVLPDTLTGTPQDFGRAPIEGDDPYLTPDRQFVVFRQGAAILRADLKGTTFTPLIQNKQVERLWGVLPDDDPTSYNLIFSAPKPEIAIAELWVATIQGAAVRKLSPLPYSPRWFALAAVKMFGARLLYEYQDTTTDGKPAWNIYLTPSPEEAGQKLTSDEYQNRYPAWNLDGTQIVYVSNRDQ